MASHSLEEAEPCNNGEAALQTSEVYVQDDERTASSLSIDGSLASSPHITSSFVSVDTPVMSPRVPPEEAQKGKVSIHVMEIMEEQLLPDNATPMTLPSTEAIVTDALELASTPSTAAFIELEAQPLTAATAVDHTDTSESADVTRASQAITEPLTEGIMTEDTAVTTEDTAVDTALLAEAVIVDSNIALESSADVFVPPRETTTEAVVVGSPTKDAESAAVNTIDSSVVTGADSTTPVDTEFMAPLTTDSIVIEATPTDPTSSPLVSSPSISKAGADLPLEELNRTASHEEEELSPETDSIQVPAHWHSKPCVHISSIGGALTEEEVLPLFSKYGQITSVSFENERHDAMLIRYENVENGEELLAEVREATNSTKLGDKTLIVEPFRPDSLLFVGNLTPSIDDASLRAMFEPHGKIERAFVLRNAEGQSKCYGFVEYSLKSQAMTAKTVMGNINMDGRVLRVEWSDCKKIEDMFSTVLFIDRIPREGSHIEGALKNLFAKYGRIRDSHLAVGTANQIRGFGFIDFYHSRSADKAHQALDGHSFEGSNIRVSFANPSKSAQSYKFRYGAQSGQVSVGRGGTGGSGMVMGPPGRGSSSRGPVPRVPTPMPLLPSRFMSPARPGMLGYGIGMQFGRGPFDRGMVPPFHGTGRGMPGPNSFGAGRASFLLGNMAPRAGMAVVENKLPFGQGPVSITPSAIVQVATAQARAREEEAKARAEAARQGISRSFAGNDSFSMNQYQRLQQMQHQQVSSYDQHYKQGDFYLHQQAQQASSQPQQQAWNQQHSQQNMQFQRMTYHPNQSFPQQQHVDQGGQSDAYYQQASHAHVQQHGYTPQYGQQQGYQYSQQAAQMYGQIAQQTGDQYQQTTQPSQAVYSQQNYGDQYALHASQQNYQTSAGFDGSAGLDAAQQQAYAAYYQQQAQAQAQAATNPESSGTPQTAQQSYEAQWAAYYASQAAYQQQASSTEAGQKRSADQMDTQTPAPYNYAGYPQQANLPYQQQQSQPSNDNAAYQVQAPTSAAYQQQAAYTAASYQQQGAASVAGYQQAGAAATYPSTGQTGYEQSSTPAVEGGFQQPAAAFQGQTGVFDYSKRPRF